MAMTIVEAPVGITGGVDTHLDTHVAAALDPLGRLVGTGSFDADAAGCLFVPSAAAAIAVSIDRCDGVSTSQEVKLAH